MFTPQEIITAYYVGYYNRAPDPVGFEFWVDAYDMGISRLQIANFFADQDETRALYPYFADPTNESPASFITSVYLNLFNREPDDAGFAFWLNVLTSGSVETGQMIEAIIEGAQSGPDLAIIENKIATGLFWEATAHASSGFDYGTAEAASARSVIDLVNDTASSVTDARAEVSAFFDSQNQGDDDIAGNDFSTAQILDVGEVLEAELNFFGDEDWYLVDFNTDSEYIIETTSTELQNLRITVEPMGDIELQFDGYSFDPRLGGEFGGTVVQSVFRPDTFGPGTYVVAISDNDALSPVGSTGAYTLSVARVSENDDFASNPQSIGFGFVANNGISSSGVLEEGSDVDIFRVILIEGETYQIDLEGDDGVGGLSDPVLALLDPNGIEIDRNDDLPSGGLDSQLTFTAEADGVYFLSASGYDTSVVGSYTFTVDTLELV